MTAYVEIIAEFWDYKRDCAVPAVCNFEASKMIWMPSGLDITPGTVVGFPDSIKIIRISRFRDGSGEYDGKEYLVGREYLTQDDPQDNKRLGKAR